MLNFTDACFSTHMLYNETIRVEHYVEDDNLIVSSAGTEFLPFTKDNLVKTGLYSPENLCDFTEGEPFEKDFALRACPDYKDIINAIYNNRDSLKAYKWYTYIWFKKQGIIDSISLETTNNGQLRQYFADQNVQKNLNLQKKDE